MSCFVAASGMGAKVYWRPVPPPARSAADPPPRSSLLLALDTASPTVSVALGAIGGPRDEGPPGTPAVDLLAERSVALRRSSESLLRLVEEALGEAGAALPDLDAVLALRGPGSFTGLRVGLATVLGLHQALGVPASAVPTLPVLALAGRALRPGVEGPVAAVVDALRGEWFVQVFGPGEPPAPLGEPEVLDPSGLAASAAGGPALVVGFGARRLLDDPEWPAGIPVVEPAALAPAALRYAALRWRSAPPSAWDPSLLISPLYLRPPAVSPPGERRAKPVHPHGASGG